MTALRSSYSSRVDNRWIRPWIGLGTRCHGNPRNGLKAALLTVAFHVFCCCSCDVRRLEVSGAERRPFVESQYRFSGEPTEHDQQQTHACHEPAIIGRVGRITIEHVCTIERVWNNRCVVTDRRVQYRLLRLYVKLFYGQRATVNINTSQDQPY